MSSSFAEASQDLRQAVQLDGAGELGEALPLYNNGIEKLGMALARESDMGRRAQARQTAHAR